MTHAETAPGPVIEIIHEETAPEPVQEKETPESLEYFDEREPPGGPGDDCVDTLPARSGLREKPSPALQENPKRNPRRVYPLGEKSRRPNSVREHKRRLDMPEQRRAFLRLGNVRRKHHGPDDPPYVPFARVPPRRWQNEVDLDLEALTNHTQEKGTTERTIEENTKHQRIHYTEVSERLAKMGNQFTEVVASEEAKEKNRAVERKEIKLKSFLLKTPTTSSTFPFQDLEALTTHTREGGGTAETLDTIR
ncbi:unnamed protein product [Bemisia tabaci]|uniref:Uncharacterized protein n=1 Tax=Bemisia tabaci TaxID=7038 RepID=A0A9P0ADL5_BEMTA|nr:unnamed protein product [Bemisia tabaci]